MKRLTWLRTLIGVPVLLAVLSAIQGIVHQRTMQYLVLPPFAVIAYLIFRDPFERSSMLRSIVILPCLGALTGTLCSHNFGFTPLGLSIAALVVIALQDALRADMPPALALAVLAMLLHTDSPMYVLGVLQGTLIIFVLFRLWRRLAFETQSSQDRPTVVVTKEGPNKVEYRAGRQQLC